MSTTISAADVKALREKTGAGMMDCKNALEEAGGDIDKATELLRVKMGNKIGKLAGRETSEGTIQSYIHATGKVGVLVQVECNTDFVAKNDDFIEFAKDLALHIAASPQTQYVTEDEIPQDDKDARARVFERAGRRQAGEHPRPKIVEGKLTSGTRRSSCSTRSTSTATSTTARRSSSCAPTSRPRPARTSSSGASPASPSASSDVRSGRRSPSWLIPSSSASC